MNWELGLTLGFIAICFLAVRHDIQQLKPKKKSTNTATSSGQDSPGVEFVYVISNQSYRPGMFKIGLTTKDVNSRKSQLYTTGVPQPFDTCMVIETSNCKALEKALHETFRTKRVNNRREWFLLTADDIESIRKVAGKSLTHYDPIATQRALGAPLSASEE